MPDYSFYPVSVTAGDPFYVGYAFRLAGSETPYHFGYIELMATGPSGPSLGTLYNLGWAYEDQAGVAITTGSVIPEPSTMAIIFGAVALGISVAFRKRRSYKAS